MSPDRDLIAYLHALNEMSALLHRGADPHEALTTVLEQLISLMGLETGWVVLADPAAQERQPGGSYMLAAHVNLPPAMAPGSRAWEGACECQQLAAQAGFSGAYGEVRCSRLGRATGDRLGLAVHATVPLIAGSRLLGILNVAAPEWGAFSPEALALLENIGGQIAIALERDRLYELLHEQRIQEQASLLAFSNQLLGRVNPDDLVPLLVDEVRRLLAADACALLLPDAHNRALVFRAASGYLVDPVQSGRSVPLDERSRVGRAMLNLQPEVVEDTEAAHAADWSPDWLLGEGFRSHAVMPLLVESRAIGTLMLSMRRPRRAVAGELRLLRLMANQAAMALEQARLSQEAIRQRRMEEELRVARQIQLSMLPDASPEVPGWDFSVVYRPARTVGGDFYDFFYLPGSPLRLGIVVADVADKGVPAALVMVHSLTSIRTAALAMPGPAATLMRANRLILGDGLVDSFVTASYTTFELNTGRVLFANAGHNLPLRLSASGELEELAAAGIILGAFDEVKLEERESSLGLGDLLLAYTDGVTDASAPGKEPFGEERLRAVVREVAGHTAPEALARILEAVDAYTGGAEQYDDITLVAVRREPVAVPALLPADWSKLRVAGDLGPAARRRRIL